VKRGIGVVVDWETSGLREHKVPMRTYLEGPQGIEIGATLVFLPEFEVIAEFESRVRFLGKHNGCPYGGPIHEGLTWSEEAEAIHGIKIVDLLEAPTPSEAAAAFVHFVKSNAGIDDPHKVPVMFCGHNPDGDHYMTRQLLFLGQQENGLRFHHRQIDSFSLGYFVLGTKSSNDLFERTSGVKRGIHSALEDSRLTTVALRTIYNLCQGIKT
jgi:DNA polymerase III epsilon subunit-like protein